MLLSQFVKNCLDIVLPPCCAVCGVRIPVGQTGMVCGCCNSGVRYLTPPFCRICGMEVLSAGSHKPLCGECLRHPPPYAIARSVVHYELQTQRLVQKLKYGRDLSVIPAIKALIAHYDMTEFADIDCIVVVPLHLRRLRWRGLNQAAVLARLFFADRLALVQLDWLARTRNTVPQTKLGKIARRANLKDAFKIQAMSSFQDMSVCLVDDVFTTGTTVKECSKVIMKNGAREVRVLTLARVAVPHGDRLW